MTGDGMFTRRSMIRLLPVCGWLFLLGCERPAAPPPAASSESRVPASEAATSPPASSTPAPTAEITVSAAASTKDVLEAAAKEFLAAEHVQIRVNSGPSSGLATQILEGAPADLFLSANKQWADKVDQAGKAHARVPLLTNSLVLIVPKGNPAGVREPQDLASDKVKRIALAGENVPAGQYAGQALGKLGLLDSLASSKKIVRGQDVRTTLSYVDRGEVEAGIVYSTDVAAAAGVEQVYEFPSQLHDEIVYVWVLLDEGSKKPAAEKFYEFLQSAPAAALFTKAGFRQLSSAPARN